MSVSNVQKGLEPPLVAVTTLPDAKLVCVSDMSSRLRFYNASSRNFGLCATIKRLPSPAMCLAYAFDGNRNNTNGTGSGRSSKMMPAIPDTSLVASVSTMATKATNATMATKASNVTTTTKASNATMATMASAASALSEASTASFLQTPTRGKSKWGSYLAYGDLTGGVVVIQFPAAENDNPFLASKYGGIKAPSFAFDQVVAAAVKKKRQKDGKMKLRSVKTRLGPFRVFQFPRLHPNRVVRVEFCDTGQAVVSVSLTASRSLAYCRISDSPIIGHVSTRDHGLSCVCAAGKGRVATGGAGGSVGLWNVSDHAAKSPDDDLSVIRGSEYGGHNAGVWQIFYNRINGRLYSVALDNVFKVCARGERGSAFMEINNNSLVQ